jgi:hypothetical protein
MHGSASKRKTSKSKQIHIAACCRSRGSVVIVIHKEIKKGKVSLSRIQHQSAVSIGGNENEV